VIDVIDELGSGSGVKGIALQLVAFFGQAFRIVRRILR